MAYLFLALTPLFWAGNFVLGRAMNGVLPPISMAEFRWSIALLMILPFLVPRLKTQWPAIKANWKILVVLSVLSVASFNTLVYLGLTGTNVTNATIMQSIIPIIILIISALVFREPVKMKQWVGVLISLAGVLALISQGNLEQLLELSLNTGDAWILAAVMCWAVYSIMLRFKPAELDGFTFFGVTVVLGVLALLPFSLWEMSAAAPIHWSEDALFAILYMAVFPSILAYLFWNRGVAEVGAAKAGLFIHLMPIFGVLLASIFLEEQIQTYHIAGMVLIFTGIYLAVVADVMKRIRKTN
ncbi:DMT family transporter [Neptunomonas sp. XY-337]|uniref:DMT family transporter n=1 Tax=Neptunomonas sp. XY-337 TaxID=2561897 RepID=UPI0010A9D5E7|nr:DMT family transporter [Neptunomonas sp. XY-337]